uniref:Major facilitator superfamily (MFS) profile domain-containing protein n=1 Tax=Alexandrium monilatum TaxID=311494 RepID=A0A7S4SK82_9DINO
MEPWLPFLGGPPSAARVPAPRAPPHSRCLPPLAFSRDVLTHRPLRCRSRGIASGGARLAVAVRASGEKADVERPSGALAAILTISCLNLMGATAVAPLTPALMQHFALGSDASLGFMSSSFALGRLCTTSIWPIASDYVGRRRVICIAMVGNALGATLQGAAVSIQWSFAAFLLARGVSGVFSGIVPVLKASIVDSFHADQVPKVLAYREAAGTFAFVVGPSIGGALATWHLASPLHFAAASGVLASLIAAWRIPGGPPPGASGAGGAAAPRRRRRRVGAHGREEPHVFREVAAEAAPLLLLSFVWACTRTCFHTYYPLMLARRYSLSVVSMGGLMTSISLLVVLTQIGAFDRARRGLGLRGALAAGGVLVALGLVGVGAAPLGTPLAVFAGFSGLYAIGVALLSPAMPSLLVRSVPPGRCGTLLGVESAIANFGHIVAPPVFGLLHGYGASEVSGILTLAATLLVFRVGQRRRRAVEPEDADAV